MNIEYYWAIPIAYENIYEVDNSKIKKLCYDFKKKSSGVEKSNVGGWQSEAFSKEYLVGHTELQKLIANIEKNVNELKIKIGMMDNLNIALQAAWININEFGDYNQPHIHRGAVFAAVYYVDVDPEIAGEITFVSSNPLFPYYWEQDWFTESKPVNICNGTNIVYRPISNKLIIFPGWVTHFVDTNKSKKPRISIAFNFGLLP